VSGDQHAIRGEIETPTPLILRRVPKEDTPIGTGGQLMGSSGRGVRVAGTPEDPKVGIGGSGAEKSKVWCGG
jgi:hypothetical protein